jgi:hypothetical protein
VPYALKFKCKKRTWAIHALSQVENLAILPDRCRLLPVAYELVPPNHSATHFKSEWSACSRLL